jgi:Sec-independent protein translocase protein TatA
MAQKGGGVKRILLAIVLLILLAIAFVLLGGGKLLKSTGNWLGGVGNKAEDMKGTLEKKAVTIEKTVEKLKQEEKPGEKK